MPDEKSATESLADQLLVGALEGVKECKRIGYNPSAFLAMLHERGAVGAFKHLVRPPVEQCSDGFTRLWELKRLDLAVEYTVAFDERFAPLFSDDERRIASQRLALYGKTRP